MNFVRSVCAAALLTLVASDARADELRLKNGDRYSGTVIALAGGTLTFKTAHGSLAIPWSDVTALTIDDEIVVERTGGDEASHTGGAIDIAGTVALRRPQPAVVVSGGASAGFVDTGGNTDVNSLRVDGDVVMRRHENRYTIGAAVNRAKTSGLETARNWTATARYDRFLTRRLFVSANTIFTNDPFRDLDLRTALGAGIGYQVVDTPAARFSLEAGAGYVRQNFEVSPDHSYGALREAAVVDILPAGERVVFFHRHDLYVGVTGDDNLFVKAQNGVRFAVVAGFVATAQVDVDYDRSPEPGRRGTDRTFALTFGYRF